MAEPSDGLIMARHGFICTLTLLTFLASACSPVSPSSLLPPSGTSTVAAAAPSTSVPASERIPAPVAASTPSPTPLPPALPAPYQTSLLNPLDLPHTYIGDACQYLQDKWSSRNSSPGTVVMVIMFHKITNETLTAPEDISEYNFRRLMEKLHDQGFQAIDTTRLLGFLERNAPIPDRSVLLVVDDRHTRQYFDFLFREYWDKWGWPVVNAWISTDLTTTDLWKQQEALAAEGWVDYQAHGFIHDVPIGPDSSDTFILGELQKPLEIFQEHFNKKPIAIIWPGGGFTLRAVGLARQSGYRLGFTINPRGPLMFNWVPLADQPDPLRPTWIREGAVKDPLMVLPRYWDTDAILHLDEVVQIGQAAAAYARANRSNELDYYAHSCSPAYGAIP
jgi:hypothetical protein